MPNRSTKFVLVFGLLAIIGVVAYGLVSSNVATVEIEGKVGPAYVKAALEKVAQNPIQPTDQRTWKLTDKNSGKLKIPVNKGVPVYFENRPLNGGEIYFDVVAISPNNNKEGFTGFLNTTSTGVYRWLPNESGNYTLGFEGRAGNGPILVIFSQTYPN